MINGDGARWIDKGADDLPDCVRQLDGFHLARACSRGWENGGDMYAAYVCSYSLWKSKTDTG